jgi:hypothetical protein
MELDYNSRVYMKNEVEGVQGAELLAELTGSWNDTATTTRSWICAAVRTGSSNSTSWSSKCRELNWYSRDYRELL